MPPRSAERTALDALAAWLADPTPRPLHGTGRVQGIFKGKSQAVVRAAKLCEQRGWVEPTGTVLGTGKSRRPVFRLATAGLEAALEVLPDPRRAAVAALGSLDAMRDDLRGIAQDVQELIRRLEELAPRVERAQTIFRSCAEQIPPIDAQAILDAAGRPAPPTSPPTENDGWLDAAVQHVRAHRRRRPLAGGCPVPDLYHKVAEPLGLSIGAFHDGLRRLVAERRIRLDPYTGSRASLKEGALGLIDGQEIKYYAAPGENG